MSGFSYAKYSGSEWMEVSKASKVICVSDLTSLVHEKKIWCSSDVMF